MRGTVKEILSATFGIVILVIILEHAGAFSKVLTSGSSAYVKAVSGLEGH
jgi:hypothetical protein